MDLSVMGVHKITTFPISFPHRNIWIRNVLAAVTVQCTVQCLRVHYSVRKYTHS